MKKKYCIGFFVAIFVIMILLEAGYRWSYNRAMDRQLENQTFVQDLEGDGTALETDGNAKENSEYLLKELNGYVIVYLGDGKTVYEVTEISVEELPEELQTQILEGMKLDSTTELYAFLENYSS